MKICYVWDADYPWDIRVEKFCRTLIGAGHEVHLLCRNKNQLPLKEVIDGIHIHRHPFVRNRAFNAFIGFPAFFNPSWLYFLFKLVFRKSFNLIIVRDLPLALAGIAIGRTLGIPVQVDMAEIYPLGLRSNWKYNRMTVTDLFVRNPYFADAVEWFTVRLTDHIFSVSLEAREWFLQKGVSPGRITEVGNTPDLERFDPNVAKKDQPKLPHGAFNIIFVGIFTGNRGLKLAVSAMAEVVRKQADVHLTFVGDGWIRGEIEELVEQLGLKENVHFTGWIDNPLVPSFIAEADLGLLPFLPCEHIHVTLPNKLFDYMAMGLPVLAADTRSLKRVLNETECGITFKAASREELAAKILIMHDDVELRRRCAANGRKFALKKYNWGKDAENLLAAISRLDPKSEGAFAVSD